MARPKKDFEPYPQPQKITYWTPKSKKDPINRSISKVKIKWSIDDKSCSPLQVNPKNIVESFPLPQK